MNAGLMVERLNPFHLAFVVDDLEAARTFYGEVLPHFGVVLPPDNWKELAQRLQAAKIRFVIEPTIRFEGLVGEQATMFFQDPAGNSLEFKSFADISQLFAK